MGSGSGSVTTSIVGLSFGKTFIDDNCVMLKNSREFWNMGMRGAALARMCMDNLNLEALELSGFVCPQTLKAQGKLTAAATPVVEVTPVTPVVPVVPKPEPQPLDKRAGE